MQNMVNMQAAQPQAPPPPLRDRLGDFHCTKSPTFSHALEPMDVDAWLKSIEKKVQVLQCNNREKVLLASYQLSVPTTDSWDAYVEAHDEPESIKWPEFRAAFRAHHVPQGVIKLKKKEFQDLKQGSMSVNEYITRFTQLSCYAPHEVDTDEKKQEYFLNGLNDGLANALEAQDFENLQGMVNKALMLENHRGVMEHKHKLVRQHEPGSSYVFSWTCVPSCSAVVSTEAAGSWTRIFHPVASSESAPQQFPDPCYWESECSEDSSCSEPTIG
jgi:hypothetical protein